MVTTLPGVTPEMNWTGLAEMVGQSETADTGESDREVVELVSDKCGEYFLWSIGWPDLVSIVLTRLALLATTLAVLMTGELRAMTGVAETRWGSGACWSCLDTAVEG